MSVTYENKGVARRRFPIQVITGAAFTGGGGAIGYDCI